MTTQATNALTDEQKVRLEQHQKFCVYCFAEQNGVEAADLEESATKLWTAWKVHEDLFRELGLMRVAA